MTDAAENFADRLLGFTIPSRHARGRALRLDRVVDEILSAHDYPAAITHLLGEALVLAALIGGLLKQSGDQLTMQAQTEGGVVKLLVCDYRDGELRGYVDFDSDRLAALGTNPSLYALFGKGYLAITFDMARAGVGEPTRYQGIVPLEGESLAEACQTYFFQSEQVPTLIRVAVRASRDGCVAGGLLIQHLPEGEEGRERLHAQLDHPEWEHVAVLGGSIRHDELLDRELSLEAIIWRLFHEEAEIRVTPGAELVRGCRCSKEHFEQVLSRFTEEERSEMRDETGMIPVDCAFCSKIFPIAL
ncbi:MAG: Hsp33 family molecular chaperone HslO [Sphingomonadales bacterium]|nr:Hsp33 family molecular chaperone HslO [Sphingomonadales bacterium]MBD3774237.1 Hsp33 family molecular chaperone HslO [Paracoccaceae bacterium]